MLERNNLRKLYTRFVVFKGAKNECLWKIWQNFGFSLKCQTRFHFQAVFNHHLLIFIALFLSLTIAKPFFHADKFEQTTEIVKRRDQNV